MEAELELAILALRQAYPGLTVQELKERLSYRGSSKDKDGGLKMLRPKDAARLLGVSTKTVFSYLREGRLPRVKLRKGVEGKRRGKTVMIGGTTAIPESALRSFIESRAECSKQEASMGKDCE